MPPLLVLPVRAPAGTPLFPVITTASLPDATAGTAYGLQLYASFGAPPYTWSVISALPNSGNWLSLSSSGLLTGTPGTAELELLTIQVVDTNGRVGASSFRLLVGAPPPPPLGLTHGQLVTITGSGFGTKSRGLPPLLDDHGQAAIGTLDTQWNGGSSPATSNPTYTNSNIVNRLVTFSPTGAVIGRPHPNVGAIQAGAHWLAALDSSYGVWAALQMTLPTLPCVMYARWYERCDPNWSFTPGETTNDQNIKNQIWSTGGGVLGNSIIHGYNLDRNSQYPSPNNNTQALTQVTLTQNNVSISVLEIPDRNGVGSGGTLYGQMTPSPFCAANGWILKEIEICVDQTLGASGKGFIKQWANGVQLLSYAGRTDNYAGTSRAFTPHTTTYTRDYGLGYNNNVAAIRNWAYLADAYIDLSGGSVSGHCARVIWGDATTLAASTIRAVMRNYTVWNDTTIKGPFPQDRFTSGMTAYPHVVTENGTVLDNQGSGVVA